MISCSTNFALCENTINCFSSFLKHRTQQVSLGGFRSPKSRFRWGVLQRSSLSLTLFNIYMKPLIQVICESGVPCHSYVDDTQLFVQLPIHGLIDSSLPVCLGRVEHWMAINQRKINNAKTELLMFNHNQKSLLDGSSIPPILGQPLSPKPSVKSLGLLLDTEMSLEPQVSVVCKSLNFYLYSLRRIFPLIPLDLKAIVAGALVNSRFFIKSPSGPSE